jgi:hypothetical protein
MDFFTLLILAAVGGLILNGQLQAKRIQLLGLYLAPFHIEPLMRNLNEGYMRALGENEPERQDQIWQLLHTSERQLAEQLHQFATALGKVPDEDARASLFAMGLPFAEKLFPQATFDIRAVLQLHAQGISTAVEHSAQPSAKSRARRILAEMYLLQHTCHWFCKSKAVASARLLAQHQTRYESLLDMVCPSTKQAYLRLMQAA